MCLMKQFAIKLGFLSVFLGKDSTDSKMFQ